MTSAIPQSCPVGDWILTKIPTNPRHKPDPNLLYSWYICTSLTYQILHWIWQDSFQEPAKLIAFQNSNVCSWEKNNRKPSQEARLYQGSDAESPEHLPCRCRNGWPFWIWATATEKRAERRENRTERNWWNWHLSRSKWLKWPLSR